MIKERLTIHEDTVKIQSTIMGEIKVPVSRIPKVLDEKHRKIQIRKLTMVLTEDEVRQLKQFL